MDTKWKKYKFSNTNKILCVLLSCFMAVVMMSNAMSLLRYCVFFGNEKDFLNPNRYDFYSSSAFERSFLDDMESIEISLTGPAREQQEQNYIDSFLANYKKAGLENRLSDVEVLSIIYSDPTVYHGDKESQGGYYKSGYLSDGRAYYQGDDGYYYTHFMVYEDQSLALPDDSRDGINFGHSDSLAVDMISYYYDHYLSSYSYSDYYDSSLYDNSKKNISYYASYGDEVITNVSDTAAFISRVESGQGDYIYYNSGTNRFSSSENLKHFASENAFNPENYILNPLDGDFTVYISINPEFSEKDSYQYLYNDYNEACLININYTIINILVSAVSLILLAVVLCRLAGHKNGTVSMSKTDKIPVDLQFILMAATVGLIGAGVFVLLLEHMWVLERPARYFGNGEVVFYHSGWLYAVTGIGFVLIWLIILGFAMSVSRAVKADYPVFKNMLIVKILKAVYKVLVWILKGIGKGAKCFGNMIAGYAFRPKKLHKRSVPAVVFYTLFNIVSVLIIVGCFADGYGFSVCCGLLGILVVLGLDALLVYKAVKYMKSLDDIIESAEKGEPLPYNTSQLPASLKILADSLEKTNAELQQAVIKAVKDERTKTELITNVSHDLKTPLTSVINYIDLLQKCDIDNEYAKKYMAVIAEKSNKLKRLIEDLIEASKVSSGNVTINKTMLNLNELAAQAVVEETADIEKNNLQVIFEESADKHIVYADGTKIYRVFENLLSNARKYSAPGSRVYARVYSDTAFGYFEIKNISREQLNISAEELTERFVRGDQSRSQDGNGLGLSIAKELCRLNNGELIISIDGDLFKATVKIPKQ